MWECPLSAAKRVAVEKSDSAIVAGEPTNRAVPTGAEPAERRAGTEPSNHVTCAGARTGCRNINVLPVTPKVGACAGILPYTDLGGGRSAIIVPTELRSEPTGPTRPSRKRGHCDNIVEVAAQ